MKGWLKLLVLGAVPILAVTMVADQTLAADKGSQLIFQSNMAHVNFISIVNAHPGGDAVTVLVRYYNDEMKRVAWYLRVIPGGTNVLVDPFNHAIPGTAKQDDDDEDIPGSEKNVSELLGSLPAWSNDDEGPGRNSGHFVIAVTAVAANSLHGRHAGRRPCGRDRSQHCYRVRRTSFSRLRWLRICMGQAT